MCGTVSLLGNRYYVTFNHSIFLNKLFQYKTKELLLSLVKLLRMCSPEFRNVVGADGLGYEKTGSVIDIWRHQHNVQSVDVDAWRLGFGVLKSLISKRRMDFREVGNVFVEVR